MSDEAQKQRLIYKYQLEHKNGVLAVPWACTVIHVGEQEDGIYLWVEFESTDHGDAMLEYYVAPTGTEFKTVARHYKTIQMRSGLVWHVYLRSRD